MARATKRVDCERPGGVFSLATVATDAVQSHAVTQAGLAGFTAAADVAQWLKNATYDYTTRTTVTGTTTPAIVAYDAETGTATGDGVYAISTQLCG